MHDGILSVRVQNTTIKFVSDIAMPLGRTTFQARGPICLRPHSDRMSLYMSHFAEAAATSRICNSINIVRVRSGLTVFIFWVKLEWMPSIWLLVRLCANIHLRYLQNYLRHLIVWALYLNIGNTCHWHTTYFSRRHDLKTHVFLHIFKFQCKTSATSS